MSPLSTPDADGTRLAALQQQEPAAFRELIHAHHGGMLAVARTIVGEAFAEEVVQDTWLAIYNALPDFEGRSTLKTWMYKIVANGAKTRLRRENRQVSLDALEAAGACSYLDGERFTPNGFWKEPPPAWGSEAPETLQEESDLRKCIEATLAFSVEGIEPLKGVLRVALYHNERDWLNEQRMIRARVVVVRQGVENIEIWGLPAGDYAVAVYHDRNNNGRLDTRLGVVPAEPWGVSNNAKGPLGLGTPSFKDSVYTVPSNEENVITLNPPPLPE